MKFLAYLFVFVVVAVVFYAALSFIRFSYIHLKAFIIRRKLSKLSESEKKDD